MKLLEREAAHQRSKYIKYKKLNRAFSEKKNPKEETVIIYDTLDSEYSSSSKDENYPDDYEKTSISYNSESSDDEEISNISLCSEGKV